MNDVNDAISRQAAIEAIEKNACNTQRIIDAIKALLTVEPERKKGNWVWKDKKEFCPSDCWFPPTGFEDTWNEKEGSWIEKQLYCSECNFENWRHYKSNFCPKCGADMRQREE